MLPISSVSIVFFLYVSSHQTCTCSPAEAFEQAFGLSRAYQIQYGLEPTPLPYELGGPKWSDGTFTWSKRLEIGYNEKQRKTYLVSYTGDTEDDKDRLHKTILHVLAGLTLYIQKAKLKNGPDDTFIIPYHTKLSGIEKRRMELEKEINYFE
jgi:hypothetical protein